MNNVSADKLAADYPSLRNVYPIAIAVYESMSKRVDAINGRIQTTMALFLAICGFLGGVLLKAHPENHFTMPLKFAVILVATASVLGCVALLKGKVRLLAVRPLWDGWLYLDEPEFQKDMIFNAAKDEEQNNKMLELKWRLNVALVFLFSTAVVLLMIATLSG